MRTIYQATYHVKCKRTGRLSVVNADDISEAEDIYAERLGYDDFADLCDAEGPQRLVIELVKPSDADLDDATSDDDDDDWRREQAMEAGMLHGVHAYNDAMGWDVETDD